MPGARLRARRCERRGPGQGVRVPTPDVREVLSVEGALAARRATGGPRRNGSPRDRRAAGQVHEHAAWAAGTSGRAGRVEALISRDFFAGYSLRSPRCCSAACSSTRPRRAWSRSSSPRSSVRRGERSRLARLPRPDGAQRGDVRPARACLRVLHLRHALLREHSLPGQRQRVSGAAAGGPGHRGGGAGPARAAARGFGVPRGQGGKEVGGECFPPRGSGGVWVPPGAGGVPGGFGERSPARAGGLGGIVPPRKHSEWPFRDLARGPARLCQALDIDLSLDGADVCVADSPLRVRWPGATPRLRSAQKKDRQRPRVGVSAARPRCRGGSGSRATDRLAYRPAAPRRRKPLPPRGR